MCFFVNDSPPSVAPEPHVQAGDLVLVYEKVALGSQSGREASTPLKSGWGFRFMVASLSTREVWSWGLESDIVREVVWTRWWRDAGVASWGSVRQTGLELEMLVLLRCQLEVHGVTSMV